MIYKMKGQHALEATNAAIAHIITVQRKCWFHNLRIGGMLFSSYTIVASYTAVA